MKYQQGGKTKAARLPARHKLLVNKRAREKTRQHDVPSAREIVKTSRAENLRGWIKGDVCGGMIRSTKDQVT